MDTVDRLKRALGYMSREERDVILARLEPPTDEEQHRAERVPPPCPANPSAPCACLDPSVLPPGCVNACSAVHHYFGLSYAGYLVLRRSYLQSMPPAWQARFVALLREMDAATDHLADPVDAFDVTATATAAGVEVHDPFLHYDRGRRRLPPKVKPAAPGRETAFLTNFPCVRS